MSISVVLADDHPVVRSGLRMLLDSEPDITVVAGAGNTVDALRAVLDHRPSVLVLDVNMPGDLSSLDAIPLVRVRCPVTATVVLTINGDPEFARQTLLAGALGYVLKNAADTQLVEAIRLAAGGEGFLDPVLATRIAFALPDDSGTRLPDQLTGRECQVLRLIALGHTNGEIAGQLSISSRTVDTHRSRMQAKTGCSTRAEVVGYAVSHHMLDD